MYKPAEPKEELESQVVVSHHVNVRNQTYIFCKISKFSKPLSHLSSSLKIYVNGHLKIKFPIQIHYDNSTMANYLPLEQ